VPRAGQCACTTCREGSGWRGERQRPREHHAGARREVAVGRARLAVELNAFNVFNRVNLGAPNASLSSTLFVTITSTAPGFGPRQLQVGGKLTF
jgi:hypothetical protein